MIDETEKSPASKGRAASSKPAAGKPAKAAKPEKPAKAAKPAPDGAASVEVDEARVLRKKALVQRVAETAGVRKKDARAVTEAVLAEIGAALSRGEGLVLPPLGKVRVNRQKDKGAGEVLVVKLRRGGGESAQEGLAEAED